MKSKYKNYHKHVLSFICPICTYYKIKEKVTGKNYNLDKQLKQKEVKG